MYPRVFTTLQITISKLLPTSHHYNKISSSFRTVSRLIMKDILKPPEAVRGLTELDKSLFNKEVEVPCLFLKDTKISAILPLLKKYLLKLQNFKPVQNVSEDEVNIFINPQLVEKWSSFPEDLQISLQNLSVTESRLRKECITLTYENFTAEDIFKAVLPGDKEGMSSFTKAGHIVHVNLREHLLPYKKIIGEVLYDKVAGCRSVVNKVNMIDNTYRNFKMEVLKGEDDMITVVKENNCTFKFDFSSVYWNSRLCTEHERIVKKIQQSDVLFDVFAGVGPFSVPAAKKKCHVYANDLNPESYKWLNYNAKSNKIKDEYFRSFNKDGRDFIKEDIHQYLPGFLTNKQNVFIVMNLPGMAVTFLNAFVGLFKPEELSNCVHFATLFVYCFDKGENCIDLAKNSVIENFGIDVSDKIVDVFKVRTVSSLKEMMRVTVRLDRDILIGNLRKRKLEEGCDSDNKKCIAKGDDNGERAQEKNQ